MMDLRVMRRAEGGVFFRRGERGIKLRAWQLAESVRSGCRTPGSGRVVRARQCVFGNLKLNTDVKAKSSS